MFQGTRTELSGPLAYHCSKPGSDPKISLDGVYVPLPSNPDSGARVDIQTKAGGLERRWVNVSLLKTRQ